MGMINSTGTVIARIIVALSTTRNTKGLIRCFVVQAERTIARISLLVLVRIQAGIMRGSRELLAAYRASKHVFWPTLPAHACRPGADSGHGRAPLRQCQTG